MVKVKNKAKKNLSDRVKVKVKKSTNPFEVHVNRQKFSVIGRSLKHDKGLPGVARSKAFTKRKATLLREYQVKNKANKFMDKRIGEKNKYMSFEDKMTARFTAEKMKEYKNSVYNLAEGEVLTHRGHALSEIEKFDDPKSDDDDDERDKLDAKFVTEAHFGGFLKKKEETESQAKSRKELIDQLIAESKKRRYEKQKMQDETLEMTDKLDSLWKDLRPVVAFGSFEKPVVEKTNEETTTERPRVDPYDLAVQQLKFEARGKPSEKLKTEEEIAVEEKQKLEQLESDRVRRMHGFLDETPKSHKHRSADDLDDGFALESDVEENNDLEEKTDTKKESSGTDNEADSEEESRNKDDVDEEHDKDQESDMEADGESEEGSEGGDTEDSFSDLQLGTSEDEEEETVKGNKQDKGPITQSCDKVKPAKHTKKTKAKSIEEDETVEAGNVNEAEEGKEEKNELSDLSNETKSKEANKVREELLRRKKVMDKAREELPYTFEVPGSYDSFADVLKGLNPEQQSVVLERMIKCTHPSLKSGNKQRLENVFAYLLQHINDCPAEYEESSLKNSQSRSGYCFSVLRNVVPHMYDLAHISPENATYCVTEVIKEKFEELNTKFPGIDTLLFLKVIPQLFPTSDFRHPVSTPALIVMTQALKSCKVKSKVDVASGLFMSTLMLEYSRLSKRYSPEVVNFLFGLFYLAIPKAEGLPAPPVPPMFNGKLDDRANLLVIVKSPVMNYSGIPDLVLEAEDLDENRKIDSLFKVRALGLASRLALSWIEQLKDLPSCKEIFIPFINLIALLPISAYPQPLVDSIKILEHALKDLVSKCTPIEQLAHAAKKPKALKLYEPAIEDVFDGQKRRKLSRERSEREKLVHKYKKEMKGAIREIRRDKDFLAKVKLKETLRSDVQRIAKVKEIFGTAALQQGELRKIKRKK